MPDYSRITVFILTPLIFRYHLTFNKYGILQAAVLTLWKGFFAPSTETRMSYMMEKSKKYNFAHKRKL